MERSAGNLRFGIMIAAAVICVTIGSGPALAQCRDHPAGLTAVRFVNESSYELTFFIDDDDKGTVAIGGASPEWEVYPGEHMLRAGAVIGDQALWVWVVNEVPRGQVCTWTITDPPLESSRYKTKYKSIFPPSLSSGGG